MENVVWTWDKVPEAQLKQLASDTESEVRVLGKDVWDNARLMCPHCGNHQFWRLNVEVLMECEIVDGRIEMPDPYEQFYELLNGFWYEQLAWRSGMLMLMYYEEGGSIDLSHPTIGEISANTLSSLFELSMDDYCDAYGEQFYQSSMDEELFVCANCRSGGQIRDLSGRTPGWSGEDHGEHCSGCFMCADEFPSREEIYHDCSQALAEALNGYFTRPQLEGDTEVIRNDWDSFSGAMNFECNQNCGDGNWYSCLQYGLAANEGEILDTARDLALMLREEGS